MPFDQYSENTYVHHASHHLLAIDTSSSCTSIALMTEGKIISDAKVGQREHAKWILPAIHRLLSQASLSLSALDAIAYGRGPGSFTGLRIGCSIAKGLSYAHDIPLIPVSNLHLIAQQAYNHYFTCPINVCEQTKLQMMPTPAILALEESLRTSDGLIEDVTVAAGFLSIINAHMNQFYWAYYDKQALSNSEQYDPRQTTFTTREYLSDPLQIVSPNEAPFILTGIECETYISQLPNALHTNALTHTSFLPNAATMLQIAIQRNLPLVDANSASLVYLNNPFS